MKEIRDILLEFERFRGQPLALATLVRVQGSSYRRLGARMLISAEGKTVGSLSAGCLEAEVTAGALEVIDGGEPRLMEFDTRRRFGCNGSIEIFIERVEEEFFRALTTQLINRRHACVVATTFQANLGMVGSRVVTGLSGDGGTFVQEFHPPIRVVIIGSDADSRPLERFAEFAGWESHTIGNITEWDFEVDPWTAVVVKTHNYGRDCAALRHLLPLGLRYLGLIGPRRRRDELLNDVLDSGVTIASELFAPAGLHLNADSPEEIALSVIAEIQAVFANGSCVSLRDRKAPIHESPNSESQFVAAASPP